MEILFDLHLHSCCSDGDENPENLPALAKEKGLLGVVLTDHDTICGWETFYKAAKLLNLWTIQGIEISSDFDKSQVHILGYSKSFELDILTPFLKKARELSFVRMEKMAELLKMNNIAEINVVKLQERKGAGAILRKYDLQKELTSNYGITLKEAGLLVNQGGIAYIPYEKETVSPKQAIDLIHQANGLAILAHPGEIMKRTEGVFTERAFYNRIKDIIDFGIDGIEVFSPSHNEEQTDAFFDIVRQKGLLITGGSDFHGLAQAPQRPIAQSGIGRKLFDKFLARIGN